MKDVERKSGKISLALLGSSSIRRWYCLSGWLVHNIKKDGSPKGPSILKQRKKKRDAGNDGGEPIQG